MYNYSKELRGTSFMDKRFAGILLAMVLLFTGFVLINGKKDESKASDSKSKASLLSNHVVGNKESKVTLIEYGDFQCPYCQQYATTVDQVVEANKDKIQFQFRNFPLISLHQNAFAASRAAEAAHLQGKFWEMYDTLYETSNWQVWSEAKAPTTFFDQYAKQLGLNEAKFKSDFSSDKVNDTVTADLDEGNRLGITGTPSFYLNGKQVQIANDPAAFQKVIDAELAKQAKKN